jgi:hypothetical protein
MRILVVWENERESVCIKDVNANAIHLHLQIAIKIMDADGTANTFTHQKKPIKSLSNPCHQQKKPNVIDD